MLQWAIGIGCDWFEPIINLIDTVGNRAILAARGRDGFYHGAVELFDYEGQEETMTIKHPTISSTEPGQKMPWAPPEVTIISGVGSTGGGLIAGGEAHLGASPVEYFES